MFIFLSQNADDKLVFALNTRLLMIDKFSKIFINMNLFIYSEAI